jgi:large repetitive protein
MNGRILLFFAMFLISAAAHAQLCDPTTPNFNVNLVGQPGGTWTSTAVQRVGHCCSASGSEKCIQFIVMLDSNATAIRFDVISGALPGGALYYQVNCGPPQPVGTILCLTGPGPHIITFCKPGNNLNIYSITSLAEPGIQGTEWVTQACTGTMSVNNLVESSITWTSIPVNATYNSYLSCTSGCDSVTINPTGTMPAYVDYMVCGVTAATCVTHTFCDTLRVNFANNLAVNITPVNPVICYGSTGITLTANPSGGLPPFRYTWSTGATTASIFAGVGTYIVSMTDSMNCMVVKDTVTVTSLAAPITASAGPDKVLCVNDRTVTLNGIVNIATGGIWSGGTGTFSPSNTSLTTTYTPSAAEISAGSATLLLTTTGNSGCPGDTDNVIISISQNPPAAITGNTTVCERANQVYHTTPAPGCTYSWSISGGAIISSAADSVVVYWPTAGTGQVTVTVTNALMCDSSVSVNVIINPLPSAVITGPATACFPGSSVYTVPSIPGYTYSWTATNSTPSTGSLPSFTANWNAQGTSTLTLTVTSDKGCVKTGIKTVTIYKQPAPVITGNITPCEFSSQVYSTPFVSGTTWTWSVNGGVISTSAANSVTVTWSAGGPGSITVTENNNGCITSTTLNVIIDRYPTPLISGQGTICSGSSANYFTGQVSPLNTYSWSVVNGFIVDSSTVGVIQVSFPTSGQATISLTETTPAGCSASYNFPVTVYLQPTPNITGPAQVCDNDYAIYNSTLTPNTFTWSISGGNITSQSGNTINVQWTTPGTGIISLTENNASICQTTDTIHVNVSPTPVTSINGPTQICSGSSADFFDNTIIPGNTYSWTVAGGMITSTAVTGHATILFPASGTASITLTETTPNGCDSTSTFNVTIFRQPTPSIAGSIQICRNETTTYITPVSTNNFTWTVSGGNIISQLNNVITVQWITTSTGMVTVTENNSSVCVVTDTLFVNVSPLPGTQITGPVQVCSGTSSVYSDISIVSGNTYTWSVTNGAIVNTTPSGQALISFPYAGSSVITLTEITPDGCDSTITFDVLVYLIPTPDISGPAQVCRTDIATYTTAATQGLFTWNVTGGNILSQNNNSIIVEWITAGTGTISVWENNSGLCFGSDTMSVIIGAKPDPIINGPSVACSNSPMIYSAANIRSGETYNWTVTNGSYTYYPGSDSIVIIWDTAGTGIIVLDVQNPSGCDSSITFVVTVLDGPTPQLTGIDNVCLFDTATYSVPYRPGHMYNWQISNGNIVGFTVDNEVSVYWSSSGTGTITLQEISQDGCDSTVTLNVVINPLPAPAIFGPTVICERETNIFYINAVNTSQYQWVIPGGIIAGGNLQNVVAVNFPDSGLHSLTIYETNSFGCISSSTTDVNVGARPRPHLSGMNIGCIDGGTHTYDVNNQPNISYSWTVQGGNIMSGNGTSNIGVEWLSPGYHTITVLATNTQTGCDSSVNMSVLVDSLPQPVVTSLNLQGCAPSNMAFTNNYQNPSYNYTWTFGDGTSSNSANPTHIYSTPGNYTVHVIATNNTGCSDTAISLVRIHPVPTVDFVLSTQNNFLYAGIEGTTLQNYSSGVSMYTWDFGNGQTSHLFEPTISYTDPGFYTITLAGINQYGCRDTARIPIEVKVPEQIFVPNTFTPNGDNINDYFTVSYDNIVEANISIFNRWGEQIFNSSDLKFSWDGTYKGDKVQTECFVYLIDATGYYGTKIRKTGTITVLH